MITDLKQFNDESIEHGKRRRIDYESQEEGELALAIPKQGGGDIKITLLEHAYATEEQSSDYQLNTLLRLRPLAEMSSSNQSGGIDVSMLREGYLYIFFHDRLWRELKVDEQGRMSDVDLNYYRKCVGNEQDDRTHEGIWLDDILVPIMLQGQYVMHDVRIGFSEIAWSWSYITWLEQSPDRLEKRAQPVGHACAVTSSDEISFDTGFPAQKVSTLPAMRSREPVAELMLENPAEQFTIDYTTPPQNSLCGKLRSKWQLIVNNAQNTKSTGDVKKEEHEAELTSLPQMLDHELEAGVDALLPLREEVGVVAVNIADPLFTLRHALSQIRVAFHYLDAIETSLSFKPLAHSAMLLRQALYDRSVKQEDENTEIITQLRQALDKNKLDAVLENSERSYALALIKTQVDKLRALLESGELETHLRDYASHHHLGVIESFSLGGALINTLRQIPDTARKHGTNSDFDIPALLTSIFDNPLLMAFWSPENAEELMKHDLPPAGKIESSDGSGKFRPNFIRSLVDTEVNIDEKSLAGLHLEGLALLTKHESNSSDLDGAITKTAQVANLVKAAIEGWGSAVLASVESLVKENVITEIKVNRLFSILGASIKHTHKEFSSLRLLLRDDVKFQNFTIIGVHGDGLHYGMTDNESVNSIKDRSKYLIADIMENNNESAEAVASTSKKNTSQMGAITKIAGSHSVFVVPQGHEMAKQLTTSKINLAKGISVRLNSEGISKLFLGFALYNLKNELQLLSKKIMAKESIALQGFKLLNSSISSIAASMKLMEVMLGEEHKWVKHGIQRPLFSVKSTPLIGKRLMMVGGNTLVKTASLVNFAAGGIGIGISAYEIYNSFSNADYDAALAHSVAMTGGIIFLSSPILATCLAIPGWGWAVLGLGLIIGGGLWAASATDSELEKHLKLGPLGIAPDPDTVPPTDNDYYPQLLSLLCPFQLNACRVADAPTDDIELQTWLKKSDNNPNDMLITLGSPLISQFPSWKSDGLTITTQELKYTTLEAGGKSFDYLKKQTPLLNLKSVDFLPSEHAIRFVVGKQFKAGVEYTRYSKETIKTRLRICIQVSVKTELGEHVIPYSLQKKNLPYNKQIHAVAPAKPTSVFSQDQAPFWFIKEINV